MSGLDLCAKMVGSDKELATASTASITEYHRSITEAKQSRHRPWVPIRCGIMYLPEGHAQWFQASGAFPAILVSR